MIRVFMIDSSPLCEELFFQTIYNGLSDERRAKVDRIQTDAGKRLSVAAGYLYDTYHALGAYYNLSHSGNLAVIAVGDRPVGVDVEGIKKPKEGVLQKCYSQDEKQAIASDAAFADIRFTAYWTIKESACKRTKEGLAGILRSEGGLCDDTLTFQSIIKQVGGEAYVITVAYKMPEYS